jgi:uncharacterized protein
MSDVLTGPWWRILTMTAPDPAGSPASAEDDYAAIHSAAVAAARQGRPLVIAWLSRGNGAPLELITTAAPSAALPGAVPEVTASPGAGPAAAPPPVRRGKHAAPARPHPPRADDGNDPRSYPLAPSTPPHSPAPPRSSTPPHPPATPEPPASWGRPLLFPPGAQAEPAGGALDDLNRLVWVPCPARPESPADQPEPGDGAGMFETALIALMRRPFGWLVVAEPTDLLDAETAGLRTELEILRRHHERRSSFAAEQTERRLAERGTFGAAGLWRVRVLAGAANPDELDVLAPLLAGAAELGPHPYHLRHTNGAQSLDAALAARHHDPADGAQTPFFVTAGTLTALAGLPRLGVPGLDLTAPSTPGPASPPRASASPSPASPTLPPASPGQAAPGRADGTPPPDAASDHDLAGGDRGPRLPAAPVATPADPEASADPDASNGRESSALRAPAGREAARGVQAPAGSEEAVGPEPADDQMTPSGLQAPLHPEAPAGQEDAAGPETPAEPDPAEPLDLLVTPVPPAPPASSPMRVNGAIGLPLTWAKAPSTRHGADEPAALDQPMIELGARLGPDDEPLRIPLAMLRRGVLVAGSAGAGTTRTLHQLLGQASDAGIPWLMIDPDRSCSADGAPGAPGAHGATVINPVDPDAVPVTVSLLAPAPGYPLHAHIALVSAVFDVAFEADEALSLVVARALREVYLTAGWDPVTGRPAGPVQVPDLRDLHAAINELLEGPGYDRATRARLYRAADVRFGSLRDGSAGRFLGGGHPAGASELLPARIVVAVHDLPPAERVLVTGTLLIQLAEHLRVAPRPDPPAADNAPQPELRHLLVLAEARTLLRDDGGDSPASRAAERFAALITELAASGTGTVLTERRPALLTPDATRDPAIRIVHRLPAPADRDAAGAAPAGGVAAVVLTEEMAAPRPVGLAPLAVGGSAGPAWSPHTRRSPACGVSCRTGRPCQLGELSEAERLAGSSNQAWLRVWTEILVLAFLTDNPLPAVPAPLCRRWRELAPRARECLLAQVAGHAVGIRAAALRPHYDPARFTEVLAAAAASRLNNPAAARVRPGPAWVIPPLRWLHEIERLCPLNGTGLATGDHAPPLDFDLPGLPDWPGIRVGQRIRALRRHPLSVTLADNRHVAWTALLGQPGPEPFADDLAQVLPGVDAAQALRHTAGLLEVSGGISAGPGWLEVVLSWPRRFVAFAGNRLRPADAADGLPG